MSNLARQFAGKAKRCRSHLHPAQHRVFRRRAVKGRIDFYGGKIARVKFEPARFWQIRRVKRAMPFVEAPCACTDANFLLIRQIQETSENNRFCGAEKENTCRSLPRGLQRHLASFTAPLALRPT